MDKKESETQVNQIIITVESNDQLKIELKGEITYLNIMLSADKLYQDALKAWLITTTQQINAIAIKLNEKN